MLQVIKSYELARTAHTTPMTHSAEAEAWSEFA